MIRITAAVFCGFLLYLCGAMIVAALTSTTDCAAECQLYARSSLTGQQ